MNNFFVLVVLVLLMGCDLVLKKDETKLLRRSNHGIYLHETDERNCDILVSINNDSVEKFNPLFKDFQILYVVNDSQIVVKFYNKALNICLFDWRKKDIVNTYLSLGQVSLFRVYCTRKFIYVLLDRRAGMYNMKLRDFDLIKVNLHTNKITSQKLANSQINKDLVSKGRLSYLLEFVIDSTFEKNPKLKERIDSILTGILTLPDGNIKYQVNTYDFSVFRNYNCEQEDSLVIFETCPTIESKMLDSKLYSFSKLSGNIKPINIGENLKTRDWSTNLYKSWFQWGGKIYSKSKADTNYKVIYRSQNNISINKMVVY